MFGLLWLVAVLANLCLLNFCTGQLFDIDSILDGLSNEGVNQRWQPPMCIHDVPTPIYFEDETERMHCYEEVARSGSEHPDLNKRANEVIKAYGYDLVTYNNVTKDGYILTTFRITGSNKSPPKKGKPVVLLFHGLGAASDQWVLQHGDRNLAFKLVNAGYEVWLANARGTDFSRKHIKLNAERDIEYWNFSFHEIAIYDFPAILDLISAETGDEKIYFIGHSMGGSIYAVALAEMPKLNQRIHAGFLLAPALFIAMRGRVDRANPAAALSPARLCSPTALRCGLCGDAIFYMYGYDGPQINFTNVPNILSKVSNSHSFKTLIHYGQNFRSCLFRKYDYGRRENLKLYGQEQPPSYNLDKVVAPTYIYYGDLDNFVPPIDVGITRDALPKETVKGYFRVKWKLFNHVDFVIAKDADILVYDGILGILEDYKFGRR